MATLKVGDVMTREVIAVAPDTSLVTTARLFAARHITGAPVIDPDGRPIGVVTQTDLTDPDRDRTNRPGKSIFYQVTHHARIVQGDDATTADGIVADVMSPFVLAIDPNAPLMEAIRLMVSDDVHRLLVTREGKLVGIVTSMDVLRALAGASTQGP